MLFFVSVCREGMSECRRSESDQENSHWFTTLVLPKAWFIMSFSSWKSSTAKAAAVPVRVAPVPVPSRSILWPGTSIVVPALRRGIGAAAGIVNSDIFVGFE
jgi:hypothetical protein